MARPRKDSSEAKETELQGPLTPLDPADEKVGEAFTPKQEAQIAAGFYPTAAAPPEEGVEPKSKLQAEQEERIESGATKEED